ncbi:imelysin family protein [Maritalea porphyrae]|uniref:imelysin family protein n=1 Tax=Maritalea porphyrae TaxID=880732 RepID=UPI0022AF971A|nr:imelysin family protein [Maritalea porphyrae]MCZ4271817.1 peptidase M75, Imelysin [Maritalea porphyrae]
MIRTIASAICALIITAPAFADGAEQRAVDKFIVPGYQAFESAADAQIEAMDALCAVPSDKALTAAQSAFSDLALSWSHIEVIRFGPVLQENRLERILFWPDRKSIGLKQVQRVIAQQDESAITIGSLVQKSVALQGLGALEFVLFGTGAQDDLHKENSFRCQYGLTIASALREVGAEISTEWTKPDGFGNLLITPDEKSDTYRNNSETMRDILGVVAHGPEIIFDTRLKKYLGESAASSAPKSALFWRSGLTFKSMAANITALGKFAEAVDFNDLLGEEDHWVADSYLFEAKNGIRASQLETLVLEAPISDARNKLEYLAVVLRSMGEIAGQDLAQALGQSAGFSSLDGD